MRKMTMLAMTACLGLLATAAMADQMSNPEYANWAKFKVGTAVTMKSTTETTIQGMAAPMKTEMTMTAKLTDLNATEATVSTTMSMMNNGQKMDMPAQTRKVPAMVDKPAADTPKPDMKDAKDGADKVTISGKSYDTKTKEGTMDMNGSTVKSKTWMSDDIPGGMAKMESTTTGASNSSTKMEVTDVTMP